MWAPVRLELFHGPLASWGRYCPETAIPTVLSDGAKNKGSLCSRCVCLDQTLLAERIAIIGAGIGGLALALALKKTDREIVLVERDPEPPAISPEEAFEHWQRPGVPQFRHAHILLARLQTLLRDLHPEVHEDLRRAGLELSRVEEVLPKEHRDGYAPEPGDAELLHFWGRRP